jgi:hypothetical protein
MSTSFEDLLELVQSTKVNPKVYVYFEPEAGKIFKIGRKDDSINDLSWINVDADEVSSIMSGQKNIDEFKVIYDTNQKGYVLNERLATVNNFVYNVLYEIPVEKTDQEKYYDVDLIVSQNLKETCWKVKVSSKIRNVFLKDGAYLNKNIILSITAKHDPNILYKLLRVDFSSLVMNGYVVLPFSEEFEFSDSDVSIFTSKVFDSYIYEIVE